MTRIALLGAGRIGQVHARAVSSVPTAKLVAVADPVSKNAKVVQEQYDCDIRTIDQILLSDDVDGVVICTPTDTHADLIEKFAKAGKAIFCEKPVDLDISRVQACLTVVQDENATLMVGFNRRVCFGRVDVRAESATGEYVAHEISRRDGGGFEPGSGEKRDVRYLSREDGRVAGDY